MRIREVKSGVLIWNVASDGITSKRIHIVTRPALNEMVERIEKATKAIQETCKRLRLIDELIEYKQEVY